MSASIIWRVWSVSCCFVSVLGLIMFFTTPAAKAQGNTVEPACRACHTWEDPVVEQGEWHTIHALQKNCCACHRGNGHASDQASAHAGMMPNPLDKPQLSCQHCHPVDYQQRTAGVAAALGHTPSNSESLINQPASAATSAPLGVMLWPQTTFRGWDWPVELAVAIVVAGLGVMRWRRVHSR